VCQYLFGENRSASHLLVNARWRWLERLVSSTVGGRVKLAEQIEQGGRARVRLNRCEALAAQLRRPRATGGPCPILTPVTTRQGCCCIADAPSPRFQPMPHPVVVDAYAL